MVCIIVVIKIVLKLIMQAYLLELSLFRLFYLKLLYLILLVNLKLKIDYRERNLTIYSISIMNRMPYTVQLKFVLHFLIYGLLLNLNHLNDIILL